MAKLQFDVNDDGDLIMEKQKQNGAKLYGRNNGASLGSWHSILLLGSAEETGFYPLTLDKRTKLEQTRNGDSANSLVKCHCNQAIYNGLLPFLQEQ